MKTWTTEQIAERVELEGLDYCIMWYMDPNDEFTDPLLKEAWLDAREALFRIDRKLDKLREEKE